MKDVTQRFSRNAIFNVVGFLLTTPILILLTPYMLRVLGKNGFGLWAIVAALSSYARLSGLGMTTALVKFVAEHWVKEDVEAINRTISTAFVSFVLFAALIIGGILVSQTWIIHSLLKIDPSQMYEAVYVITGSMLVLYFNIIFGVFDSTLQGLQRMDITNLVTIGARAVNGLGIWLFLRAGYGLQGMVWNSALVSGLTVFVMACFAHHQVPGLRIGFANFSIKHWKRIMHYSGNVLVARIFGLSQDPITKIITAATLSMSHVASLEVGQRVVNMVRQLFQIAITPLLPASADLHSRNNRAMMETLFLRIQRALCFTAIPALLLLMLCAKPLIGLWLGPGNEQAAQAMQYLLLANLLSLLVTPQYLVFQGIGKPVFTTITHAIALVSHAALALLLVRSLGFSGILISIVAGIALSSLYLSRAFRKHVSFREVNWTLSTEHEKTISA